MTDEAGRHFNIDVLSLCDKLHKGGGVSVFENVLSAMPADDRTENLELLKDPVKGKKYRKQMYIKALYHKCMNDLDIFDDTEHEFIELLIKLEDHIKEE